MILQMEFAIIFGVLLGWYSTSGVKSQFVRILDIAVWGPLVIWAGVLVKEPKWVKWLLVLIGSATIAYNLRNYLSHT